MIASSRRASDSRSGAPNLVLSRGEVSPVASASEAQGGFWPASRPRSTLRSLREATPLWLSLRSGRALGLGRSSRGARAVTDTKALAEPLYRRAQLIRALQS